MSGRAFSMLIASCCGLDVIVHFDDLGAQASRLHGFTGDGIHKRAGETLALAGLTKMKLVVTSDCHGKLTHARLPHGDVLILAGDILANRSGDPDIDAAFQLNAMRELDDFCGTLGFKHVLLIAGNHDWVFERYKDAHRVLKNIVYLEDSGTEIDGVKFWGSPHQPWFYDWAFNLPRNGRELAHYWSLIPDDTDVLITHGPPYGILDLPFGKGDPAGCELLLKRVHEVNPRVHVFGHIHGSYGKRQIGRTLFVNACLCNEAYDPVNPPHVINLDM